MAHFTPSRYIAAVLLSLIAFCFGISFSDQSSSFSFTSFAKDLGFESDIALYGDAKVIDGGSSIQLTDSVSYSTGRVVYEKLIKLIRGKSENPASFSTFFSFSMSSEHGGSLGFVVFPVSGNNGTSGSPVVKVEFDTSANVTKFGDSSENHLAVAIDGLISEKISNFTSPNLVWNIQEKLYSWLDYQAGSKRLEVRLSKSGDAKPVDSLISCPIDLSAMLNDKAVMVEISSHNANSTQTFNLHSWSFELRRVPKWMHSYPVDPNSDKPKKDLKRKDKILQVLTCFITTFGSTALLFFAMMYLWTTFRRGNLTMVVPEECGLKTKDFEYKKMEKMEVVLNKADQGYAIDKN